MNGKLVDSPEIPVRPIAIAAVVILLGAFMALHAHSQTAMAPVNRCSAVSEATQSACVDEMENVFMDQGGDNYVRGQRLKDITICRRIAEAAAMACKRAE